MGTKIIVVGSGLAGCTVAGYLADKGYKVQILERDSVIGGMVKDEQGYQLVGMHIFHTNNKMVYDYVSRFTHIYPYEHKVIGKYGNREIPLPVSLRSLDAVYGEDHNYPYPSVGTYNNAYEYLIDRFGVAYTNIVFSGYSRKQWGLPLSKLPPGIVQRVVVREDYSTSYFRDKYQGIPINGYTAMLQNMINHKNIGIQYGVSWDMSMYSPKDTYFYSGCIGELTGWYLPYRYVSIDTDTIHQTESIVNHLDMAIPYTRTYLSSNLPRISYYNNPIRCREYTTDAIGTKAYPMPWLIDKSYMEYISRDVPKNIIPIGRLGLYQYQNMDSVIASSLKIAKGYDNA